MKAWLKKVWERHLEMQKRRADYYILTTMSDRELSDLSLSRADIRRIIYGEKQ
jgi:uncharacterized protein YjiS (DUF1127 family)